jgi:hypothetical protein
MDKVPGDEDGAQDQYCLGLFRTLPIKFSKNLFDTSSLLLETLHFRRKREISNLTESCQKFSSEWTFIKKKRFTHQAQQPFGFNPYPGTPSC